MLAKANRITRGADYRATVRRGVRFSGALTVTYIRTTVDSGAVRFGFIAGKTVGDAVRRNLVRRRLKAIAYELLPRVTDASSGGPGVDIVVRALPASAQAGWTSLHEEVSRAVSRYVSRSATR